ncbi:lysis system o-spanin lipoprotein Rz1, partial [Pantoea endophytica]
MMLLLASAGCCSTSTATGQKPLAPPAWMMQPAPDLKTPLN